MGQVLKKLVLFYQLSHLFICFLFQPVRKYPQSVLTDGEFLIGDIKRSFQSIYNNRSIDQIK